MTHRTVRAAVWMVAAVAAMFALSGCNNASIGMKLVNEGAYPITEVLVYPQPAEGEAPGPEAQVNRMPQDDSGSTIALLPEDETMLPWLFRKDVHEVAVTFYDNTAQVFRQVRAENPLDLTGVKRGSLVIMTAALDQNGASSLTFKVIE